MLPRFHWTTFDLSSWLPAGWQSDVRTLAADADFREFPRTPVLSRESADVLRIPRGRVHADQVRRGLPWLYRAYRKEILELAGEACAERVVPARDERYGVVLNVQRGTTMRFECHIDSNPLTGLLFCTDHPTGGELVFAHDADAADIRRRTALFGHPAARGPVDLLRRKAASALCAPANHTVRHARRRRHELLHGVLSGIHPAQGAEQAPLRGRRVSSQTAAATVLVMVPLPRTVSPS
jgi:hypothetical protein